MKKSYLFKLLLPIAVCTQCATHSDEKLQTVDEIPAAKMVSAKDGVIPDTVYINKLASGVVPATWKDFDHYYKVTLPQFHNNQPYTQNLKKSTIYGLIQNGKLLEKADKATIAWYTQELLSFNLPDTDVLVQCLESLNGYWSDAKIKQSAETSYNDLIRYVKEHLKNPDAVLAKNEAKYNRLRDFAANVKIE
jgi:hypothetical protein